MSLSPMQTVALSANQYWQKTESLRVVLAQRLWDWYYNDENKITDYILYGRLRQYDQKNDGLSELSGGLSKVFPESYKQMTVKVFNIVQRVVDKLAFVYKHNPQRILDGGEKTEVNDGVVTPIDNKDDDRAQEMWKKSTIEKKQGAWNALAKLFNTVLVQPVWIEDEKDKSKSYMDFLIHTPAACVVETSKKDWLKASAFYYRIYLKITEGMPEQPVIVYWSETEHFIVDALENKLPVPGKGNGNTPNDGMVNPYGVLPAAALRFKDGLDFWGEGQWDLINANQEICEQVTNLAYVSKVQMHGQMVVMDPSNSLKGNIKSGADYPIHIHTYEQGQQPDVKYINANADLTPVQQLVDWWIKAAQAVKGLTPQQFSLDAKIASGVSKEIDSTEIEEIRKNDMNVCTMFESDLFDVTRTIYNYHNPTNQISTKANFSVVFPEPNIKETQTDKNARRKDALANKTASRIDLIMEDNPGMTREDAKKKFAQIVVEEREINDELGLSSILNQLDNTQPNKGNLTPEEMMNNNLLNKPTQPSPETLNQKNVKG